MARLPTPPAYPQQRSPITTTTHIARRASDGDLSAAAGSSDGSREIGSTVPVGPLRTVSCESQHEDREKEDTVGHTGTTTGLESNMENLIVAQAALSDEWSRHEFRNATYPDPSGMGMRIRGEQVARRTYPGGSGIPEEEISIQKPRPLLPDPGITQLPLPNELEPTPRANVQDRPLDQPGLIPYQPSLMDSLPPQSGLLPGPSFSAYADSSRSVSSISPVSGQQYHGPNQGYMTGLNPQGQTLPPFPVAGGGYQPQPPQLPYEYMSRQSSDRPESINSSSPNSYDYASAAAAGGYPTGGQFLYVDPEGRSIYGYPRASHSSTGNGLYPGGPGSPGSSPSLGMAMEAGMPYGSMAAAYYDSQDTGYGSPAWQGDQFPVYGGGNGRGGMGSYTGRRGGGPMMGQPQTQVRSSFGNGYAPYPDYSPYGGRGEYSNQSQWVTVPGRGMQYSPSFSTPRPSFGGSYYGTPTQNQGDWFGPPPPYGQAFQSPDGRGRGRGAPPRPRGGGRFVTSTGRKDFAGGWYAREGEYAQIGPGGHLFATGTERPDGQRVGNEVDSIGLGIANNLTTGPEEDQGVRTPLQGQMLPVKPVQRKDYHPQPPANRSEWVMWVGNVPNNVTHEEMWQFFTAPMNLSELPFDASAHGPYLGIASIFIISRSSCGFVNLKSAEDLHIAIAYFNGRSLRPWDPPCPKLVCRIRKTEDDLRAGVGGQRGSGLHLRYVKEAKLQQQQQRPLQPLQPLKVDVVKASTSTEASLPHPSGSLISPAEGDSPLEGAGRRRESFPPLTPSGGISPAAFAAWHHDRSVSGSHSFASTNSSFLSRHFPKRYFILKSSTQEELDLSVQTGTWRTQPHNEPVLDQAFRTSPEVFLVFGANRQGCFYGYALMRGPIRTPPREKRSVSWSSKIDSGPSSSGTRSTGTRSSISKSVTSPGDERVKPEPIVEEQMENSTSDIQVKSEEPDRPTPPAQASLQTPSDMRLASSSPREMTPGDELKYPRLTPLSSLNDRDPHEHNSAPPNTIPPAGDKAEGGRAHTLDPGLLVSAARHELFVSPPGGEDFELDENAPERAKRGNSTSPPNDKNHQDGVVRKDMAVEGKGDVDSTAAHPPAEDSEAEPQQGHAFKIEWIKVTPLPFTRVRHLRNPWNQDKEIKVSRDGTEIEPRVAEQLLAEWDLLDPDVKTTPLAT